MATDAETIAILVVLLQIRDKKEKIAVSESDIAAAQNLLRKVKNAVRTEI